MHFDPRTTQVVALVADKVIPPIDPIAADNEYVQRFKIQSPTLTKFWGRPIYLGATVLLPRDYKTSTISYPVNYIQGHFGLERAVRVRGRPADAADAAAAPVVPRQLAGRQLPAHDRRDVPASDAVLRRLVRRQLGEHGSVRRRDHEGADPGDREALSRDQRAVGALAVRWIDRRMGSRWRSRSFIPTSSAARGRRAPIR